LKLLLITRTTSHQVCLFALKSSQPHVNLLRRIVFKSPISTCVFVLSIPCFCCISCWLLSILTPLTQLQSVARCCPFAQSVYALSGLFCCWSTQPTCHSPIP